MSKGISLWAAAALQHLTDSKDEPLYRKAVNGFDFEIKLLSDSLWVITNFDDNSHISFRAAFTPDGFTDFAVTKEQDDAFSIRLNSALGEYNVDINWPEQGQPTLHYTAALQPSHNLLVPFWPRDI